MTRGNSRRQDSQGGGAEPVGDWWQFTLPVRYRKKVEDYMRSMSGTTTARSGGDVEKQQDPEKAVNGSTEESNTMRARIPNGTYTVHQTNTPGWSSPWQPFFLNRSGQNSQNPSGDPWSELDRPDINRINSIGRTESRNQTLWDKFSTFLLLHPAAPLVFRVLNLAFTAATLGLAARIIEIERTSQFDDTSLEGVVGTSTIYSIVVAPLTLVHIAIAVYAEYFGPPLGPSPSLSLPLTPSNELTFVSGVGIWRVSRKMIFTLVELVFIALWSAGLALSFDDLFTTPLECTAYTPNALFRGDPLPPSEISPATSAHLCDLQAALVAMVFVSVILYAAVLVVSLFRIFNKVRPLDSSLIFCRPDSRCAAGLVQAIASASSTLALLVGAYSALSLCLASSGQQKTHRCTCSLLPHTLLSLLHGT